MYTNWIWNRFCLSSSQNCFRVQVTFCDWFLLLSFVWGKPLQTETVTLQNKFIYSVYLCQATLSTYAKQGEIFGILEHNKLLLWYWFLELSFVSRKGLLVAQISGNMKILNTDIQFTILPRHSKTFTNLEVIK